MSSLAKQAVRGTMAVAAAQMASRLVSLAGSLYLMAVVLPADFGAVGYAVALLAICSSLSEWGLAQAATHRRERVEETFATYLTLRLVLVASVLALLAASTLVARSAMERRTELGVLAALAATLIVDAVGQVSATRLARDLLFGRLAIVDVAATVAATAVGVTMAALGFGIWALVGHRAAHSLARAAGLAAASPTWTWPGLCASDARWLLRFGLPLWLGGLATTWVLKYDDLVVGTLRGRAVLGHYDRAYAVALLPLGLVTGVLTRVSFPLYARLRGDRGRLSEAFRLASGTTLRLAAPLAVGLAVALPDFLAVMGWVQWQPMVGMLRCLLIYAVARPLMDDAGGLLTAAGHPRVTGHTLLAEAAALVVVCPLLTWRWGAEGAAVSVGLVVVGGLSVWYAAFLPRLIDLSIGRLVLRPLLSAGIAAGAGLAVGPVLGLGIGLAGGAARLAAVATVYLAALLLLDGRQTVADLRSLRRYAPGEEHADA